LVPADGIPIEAKILSGLSIWEMDSRVEKISEAHPKTFEWIFRKSGERNSGFRGIRFPSWLEQPSQSIYWFAGEPGSGKSTPMKFILEHSKPEIT
jgi:hypothetical protein